MNGDWRPHLLIKFEKTPNNNRTKTSQQYEQFDTFHPVVYEGIDNDNMNRIPFIHPVVDEGVDTGVGHCQPVECQVHVWCVPGKVNI